MPPEQNLPPSVPPADLSPLETSRRRYIPGKVVWIAAAVVLAALVANLLMVFNLKSAQGAQSKALAHAKQIAMTLRLFAADNEGNFPRAGMPEMLGAEVKDSNAAFAVLFPEYLTDESIFGNPQSVYQTRPPDNVYDPAYAGKPIKTLEPGENVYSYVAGLTDKSDPNLPLIADGTDGTGHYNTDIKRRGGVWSGKSVIVMHVDASGAVETLVGPDNFRSICRHGGDTNMDKDNLLDVSGLGPSVHLLDPAVGTR